MRILYIDTSSSFLYAGIVENDVLLAECQKNLFHDLSKDALPEIIKLFEKCNLNPSQIDKIIVVNGPGSFTGIRVGVTIAKVYAWSLKIAITTITSIEAMMLSSDNNCCHVPIIDARRGYVYAGIYDQNYRQILPPQHIKSEDLSKKLENIEDYSIISNDEVELAGTKEIYHPNILKIVSYFKDKENINPHAVNPEYLKLTEAEEKK